MSWVKQFFNDPDALFGKGNQMSDRPREYWIREVPGGDLFAYNRPPTGWSNQPTHVIEYSAYERVKADYAVLADMSKTQPENFTTAIKERDEALAELTGRPADIANGWRKERDEARACVKGQELQIEEYHKLFHQKDNAILSERQKSTRLVEVLLELKSWGYQTQFETIDKALAEFKEESAG